MIFGCLHGIQPKLALAYDERARDFERRGAMVAGPSVAQDCNPEPTVWGLCARRYAFGLVGQWFVPTSSNLVSPSPSSSFEHLAGLSPASPTGIALNFDWPFPGITNDALSMSCVEQFVFANDGF